MALTQEDIHEIAEVTARKVIEEIQELQDDLAERDSYIGMFIGDGAIPVHGREKIKLPCHGCRIDPDKPFGPDNAMLNTKGAIGTLSKDEIREWCSEIVEVRDGRCERVRRMKSALRGRTYSHAGEAQETFKRVAESV